MMMSSRILGEKFGLNAQEMNRVLVKLGYLEGEPGNYIPTEKAQKYVIEKEHHRGPGGYSSQYNRHYTTRTFDDSIMDELSITDQLKSEVISELAAERMKKAAERKAAEEKASADFLRRLAEEEAERLAEEEAAEKREAFVENMITVGKWGVIIACVGGACYAVYKFVPRVKKWWNNRHKQYEETEENMS